MNARDKLRFDDAAKLMGDCKITFTREWTGTGWRYVVYATALHSTIESDDLKLLGDLGFEYDAHEERFRKVYA